MAEHVLKYAKYANFHSVFTKKVYETYIKSISIPRDEPYSVLDVGCGDGRVLHEILHPILPSNYKEIVGVDKDQSMIEYCRITNKNPKISFLEMNIETNQLSKTLQNRFDVLFSSYCLMLVKNLRLSLTNCRSMLKPKGEMLLVFMTNFCPLYSAYSKLSKFDIWKPYMKGYEDFVPHFASKDPDSELYSLFRQVELEVLSRKFLHDFTYASKKRNYLEVVNSMDTISRTIPENLREQYEKDFRAAFSEVIAVDFTSDAELDKVAEVNVPNVIIHAKKS